MIGMIDIRYGMDYGMDYGMIGMKYGDFHAGSGRRCPRRPAREATWKAPARCDVVRCCQFEVRQEARGRGEQPFPSGGAEVMYENLSESGSEFRGVRTISASLDGVQPCRRELGSTDLAQAGLQMETLARDGAGARAADLATRAS